MVKYAHFILSTLKLSIRMIRDAAHSGRIFKFIRDLSYNMTTSREGLDRKPTFYQQDRLHEDECCFLLADG